MRNMSSITEPVGHVPRPEYWLNYGPSLKTKTITIAVTMLGNPGISIAWPQRERVGLIFKAGASPLTVIEALMRKEGFRSPEELRQEFEIPPAPLTCRDIGVDTDGLVNGDPGDPKAVLRQALILGLCGPTYYDPQKAVIWTNNRLSRRLDLFQPERWYADN